MSKPQQTAKRKAQSINTKSKWLVTYSNMEATKLVVDSDWRTKCIEEFKLEPVPVTWSDQVARGSEKAWKNYFEYRKKQVKVETNKGSDDDDDDDDDDEDEDDLVQETMMEWRGKLEEVEFESFPDQEDNPEQPGKWQTHIRVENLVHEYDEMRSAEFHGHVYSPYALPHAINLEHRYHRRPRHSTMEFWVVWGYKLLDFEEAQEQETGDFTTICSNCYEDEELRADVIDVSHLNQNTVDRLRRFLFGAVEESKPVCCDDFSFLRLLFGSMGTFGDDGSYETLMGGWIGYSWTIPSDSLREKMIREGTIGEDVYSFEISWLEHRMRQVAGALRPIDVYYTAPTIKDAPGFCDRDSDGDFDDDFD
jgi:hypothetical protein